MTQVALGKLRLGNGRPFFLIAGPCVIESERSALRHAQILKRITDRLHIPFIYKSSYDKANRTSVKSFRGIGIDAGLAILAKVKKVMRCPVLTDVHTTEEVLRAAATVDILQIPAFLCRQTDLLIAAARTGRVVNVKKGQFLAPWDMKSVIEKLESAGTRKILVTERGTSFGYNTLISDFRAIPLMKDFGYPVIFDATHSVQQPGARGGSSGGERRFVPTLAKAALAAGADGLFMEVHENPDKAPSDGPNMIPTKQLELLLKALCQLDRFRRNDS